MTNRFIQFELWKDCSQGCPFCCNRGQAPIDKHESCQHVLEKLKTLEPDTYDYIGLIGGEFFNGELLGYLSEFMQIIEQILSLNPRKIFITTNLIYDMSEYLLPLLNTIDRKHQALNKIVLCTSWDRKYRFHDEEQEDLWVSNMLHLHGLYPDVELHVEMIMTQHLINAVLYEFFSFKGFQQLFHCSLDFIEPSSGLYFKDKYECQEALPGFFPTRTSFIKFLAKTRGLIDFNKLFSMELRSEELYFIENGVHRVAKNRRIGDGRCELSDKTKKYDIGFIDSDDKMRDVVLNFIEQIGEFK